MMKKRVLAVILCAVMLVALCGCNEKSQTLSDNSERSLTHKISEEPIELTYFAKKLDDYKENVFTEAYDKTNILLTPTLSENVTDMDQALALAVAAKNIPDVVYDWTQENFNKYGMQGALIPLNDLIDKFAPNYKKFLEENPAVKYFSTASDIKEIRYSGTVEEWYNISKNDYQWNYNCSGFEVVCSDGTITY